MPENFTWDVVATPQINRFRNNEYPQLQIHDLRPSYI